MKLGIQGALIDTSAVHFSDVATAAEAYGFDSIWLGEHDHMPVETKHPHRDTLPDFFRRMPDPFTCLATCASVTSEIRLGTHVCLVPNYDPLFLANTVATLDRLSDGRVTLGVGYGWSDWELRNHGMEPRHRRSIFREKLTALKDLWTKEQSAFEGQHVSFTRSWLYPKPVQSPHPPIIVGAGAGPQNFADIMKYGDGWLPLTVYAGDRLADQLASFWASAEEHGRAPGSLEVTLSDCDLGLVDISFEEFTAARQRPKILEYYAGLGIHRLVVGVPFFDRDRTLACLDDIAALVPIAESL